MDKSGHRPVVGIIGNRGLINDRYPTHDKTPGALLQVGLSQYGLRDLDGAETTLAKVASQYPGTDAARTAADRLHAIQIARVSR